MTVLVLAYCLRDGGIVDAFPEIGGRNIKLVDHDDEKPWGQFCALWNPRRYNTLQSEKHSWPSLTRCLLEVRKSMIQEITGSGVSYKHNFPTNIRWSMRSKAFLKSKRTTLTVAPLPSVALFQAWIMLTRGSEVLAKLPRIDLSKHGKFDVTINHKVLSKLGKDKG